MHPNIVEKKKRRLKEITEHLVQKIGNSDDRDMLDALSHSLTLPPWTNEHHKDLLEQLQGIIQLRLEQLLSGVKTTKTGPEPLTDPNKVRIANELKILQDRLSGRK